MLVGFVSVWLILGCPITWALPPVTPPVTTGEPHVYNVPVGTIVLAVGTPLAGVTVNAVPLHIVAVCAVMTGFGFTVTVTVKAVPTHAPAAPDVGVTV
jgi:hypothetical protein